MPSFYLQPSAARMPSANILLFAGLFWIFTFAALSVRTEMLLGDAFNLFTVRRVLGTTVGAIAVSTVTDRYLEHTKEAEGWNLEEATWFLAICAVLLELKVARLTPRHTELDEDDLLVLTVARQEGESGVLPAVVVEPEAAGDV